MSLHNISSPSNGQSSGETSGLIVLDLSLQNTGRYRYSFVNESLAGLISVNGLEGIIAPFPGYSPEGGDTLLFPCTLAPGEMRRGTVAYRFHGSVRSMALYLKDRNWTIYGETFIPDLSTGNQSIPGAGYPKDMRLVAHSAAQYRSLLGMTLKSGNSHVVINVSITNLGATDESISREHLFILSEKGITLEHGGTRETPEIARLFLRFPLVIHPGETRSGSILYIHSPTRIHRLVLTDRNLVIQSMVDLNEIYQYE